MNLAAGCTMFSSRGIHYANTRWVALIFVFSSLWSGVMLGGGGGVMGRAVLNSLTHTGTYSCNTLTQLSIKEILLQFYFLGVKKTLLNSAD